MQQTSLKRLLKTWILLEATRFNRETGRSLPRWKEKLAEYERRGDFFVHFSSVPRLGLVTRNKWGTPIGFYAYPLDLKKMSNFATERQYAIVFKPKPEARLLDLQAYTEADYERDRGKLTDWGYSAFGILNAASDARLQTPGGKLWNVTRVLSGADKTAEYAKNVPLDANSLPTRGGGPTGTWTMLLRRLGYEGVLDEGDGIIHDAEPSQAVFFDTTKLDLIEIVEKEVTAENGPSLGALLDTSKTQPNADYSNSTLRHKDFSYSKLPKANFSGSDLSDVNFERAVLVLANFQDAILVDAMMYSANLTKANFAGVNLYNARLSGATIEGASFVGATLSVCNFAGSRMKGTNLTRVNGAEVYCKNANLVGATLDESDLSYSNFRYAIANKTSWKNARLIGANFASAVLHNANFQGAVLDDATFEFAELAGADFTGARGLEEAVFSGATYDKDTKFPEGFNPKEHRMKLSS